MSHESPLSINYDKLESLLSAGQWKEADQETNQLLEKIETVESRKREQDSKFRASEDIKIIDRLWTQASRGHFGFSTQAEIYRSWGGNDSLGNTQKQVWTDFCKEVGWFDKSSTSIFGRSNRKLEPVLDDAELTFNAQAPRGHLPSFIKRTKSGQFGIASLKQLANSIDFRAIHSGKGLWDLRQILERLQ